MNVLNSWTGELLAIAALILYSVSTVLTKVASERTSLGLGFLISVSINIIVCASLFGAELLLREDALHWNAYGFFIFLLAGVFSTFLGRWFFYEAVVHLGPAKASVFQISSPLFATFIAWLFLGQGLAVKQLGGIGIAILGLLIVADAPATLSRHRHGITSPPAMMEKATLTTRLKRIAASGAILGTAGSFAYAVGIVLRSAGIRSWNEPILGTLLGASSGVALHLLFSSGTKQMLSALKQADRKGVYLFVANGVCTILAQVCVIASLRYVPVSVTSLITLCSPVLVFPMSYFLLRNEEAITLRAVLGCLLTLVGIVVVMMTV